MRHAVWPDARWKVPGSHNRQVPRPGSSAKLPGRHAMHTFSSRLPGTGLALPASHCRHDALVDAPATGLYVPAGHCWKTARDAAPANGQNPPVSHCEQLVAPDWTLNEPGLHDSQAFWPAEEMNEPGRQSEQMASSAGVQSDAVHVPGVHDEHSEHAVAPRKALYVPMAQLTHVDALS